jgi:hypothetical protein
MLLKSDGPLGLATSEDVASAVTAVGTRWDVGAVVGAVEDAPGRTVVATLLLQSLLRWSPCGVGDEPVGDTDVAMGEVSGGLLARWTSC